MTHVNFGAIEPNADKRTAAREMFEMYAAYRNAGFSNVEALDLTRAMLVNALNANNQKPPTSE